MSKSTSETGHAINHANFNKLISGLTSLGAAYNPSNARISISNLQSIEAGVAASINNLAAKDALYINAVNARAAAFDDFRPFISRITAAVNAAQLDQAIKKDILTITRKLQGRRAGTAKTDEQGNNIGSSTSQTSYDALVANFDRLAELLKTQPAYNPSQTDLQITALSTRLANMRTLNDAVMAAKFEVNKARNERQLLMYAPDTGMVATGLAAKAEVASIFGNNSPEAMAIKAISLRNFN